MIPATPFDDHVVASIAKRRRFDPRALGALLKARELLVLSLGLLLAKVRETQPSGWSVSNSTPSSAFLS